MWQLEEDKLAIARLAKLGELVSEFDQDGNGLLSFDEFELLMPKLLRFEPNVARISPRMCPYLAEISPVSRRYLAADVSPKLRRLADKNDDFCSDDKLMDLFDESLQVSSCALHHAR